MDLRAYYRKLSLFLPRGFLIRVKKLISFAGYEMDEREWSGMVLFSSLISFILPFLLFTLYSQLSSLLGFPRIVELDILLLLLIGLFLSILVILIFVAHLYTLISVRKEQVEKVFPDFLYLLASNLRGGLIPSHAFSAAIRPELGVLAVEAKKARIASGGSIVASFKYLTKRVNSVYLDKFTKIFEKTIRTGGNFVDIVEEYADSMRKILDLKEELASQSKGYVGFLLFVSVLILPFLTSVSVYYIKVISSIQESIGRVGDVEGVGPLSRASLQISLTPEQFIILVSIFVVITNLMTSLLLGIINKGDMVRGLKYFPFISLVALIVMFISSEFLSFLVPLT